MQNRSLRCSCPWDRHARRLSVRDDPRATSRKTAPFFFIRISQSRFFLVDLFSEKHLSVAYFVSKCKLFDKDESVFYHKDLIRKQNLAPSWFKPASTLSSKYECWCEFEKDLKLLPLSNNERIFVGESFPYRVAKPFYSRECFYILRINVFPNLHRHLNFVVEVLMVLSIAKAWTQWSIVRSEFTSFF